MNIMNSASEENIKHRVYPLTYLRKTVFTISFRKLTKECYSVLADFISSNFDFDVTEERIENITSRPLCFGTEDHSVEWAIKDSSLDISISQEAYVSFKDTLLPLITICGGLLKSIKRDATQISLNKINLIPVTLSSYDEMKDNVNQVFSNIILSRWNDEVYQKNNDTLIYLAKAQSENGAVFEIISGFISKGGVAESQPSRYILDLTGRYMEATAYDGLIERVQLLNDQLFVIFIRSVSEEIIKSMEDI